MKRLKKVVAGLLLAFGIPFSLYCVAQLVNPKTNPKDKDAAMATLLILTLPSTALGGWIAWSLYKGGAKDNSDRLKSIFFELLMADNGRITVLQFAKATQLSGEEARRYLDERAKEFNATFNVDERGGVSYYFNP